MNSNKNKSLSKLLQFLHATERLKFTLRHGWASNGRQESVAEHSWRLTLMVILCYPYLEDQIDLEKALQMAVIHDLPEILIGDIPFFEAPEGSVKQMEKHLMEEEAMSQLCSTLDQEEGDRLLSLWQECQHGRSKEAQFIHALDKLEAQIQQNEADISTWNEFEKTSIFYYIDKFCDYDFFLKQFKEIVREESSQKLNASSTVV